MSATRIAVTASVGAVALLLVLAWVTWTYVLGPVDRVFWASLFGIGGFGGQ